MESSSTCPSSFQPDELISPTWRPCWGFSTQILSSRITPLEKQLETFCGGSISSTTPKSLGASLVHASLWTETLSQMPAWASGSAGKWHAWCLIPGWKGEGWDIRWAEAVGFKLLVCTLITISTPGECFKVFGDNWGVVEGWWKGRSWNKETHYIFRQIHDLSNTHQCTFITCYVPSKANLADEPSRGIYPPTSLLLPAIHIPKSLQPFIVNYNREYLPCECTLKAHGNPPKPFPKPKKDNTQYNPDNKLYLFDNSEWFKPKKPSNQLRPMAGVTPGSTQADPDPYPSKPLTLGGVKGFEG